MGMTKNNHFGALIAMAKALGFYPEYVLLIDSTVIPGDQTKGHRIMPKLTLFGVVATPCMVSGQDLALAWIIYPAKVEPYQLKKSIG